MTRIPRFRWTRVALAALMTTMLGPTASAYYPGDDWVPTGTFLDWVVDEAGSRGGAVWEETPDSAGALAGPVVRNASGALRDAYAPIYEELCPPWPWWWPRPPPPPEEIRITTPAVPGQTVTTPAVPSQTLTVPSTLGTVSVTTPGVGPGSASFSGAPSWTIVISTEPAWGPVNATANDGDQQLRGAMCPAQTGDT